MKLTNLYQVVVASVKGAEYRATLLQWPTFGDVRKIIEAEVLGLKKSAHTYDDLLDADTQHQVACIWSRVEELNALLELFLLLRADDGPQETPYQKNIMVGGRMLGYINVSASPAWSGV